MVGEPIGHTPLSERINMLPKRDKTQFNQLRLQVGAKAANLLILSNRLAEINTVVPPDFYQLKVPDFRAVPVDTYKSWREGTLTDAALRDYFTFASDLGSDYMVRSSAVFSEDGEHVTGAGIYDSVKVSAGATFDEFKQAVIQVYDSIDSPRARDYRSQHGIVEEEEMGLVIQKYAHSPYLDRQSGVGYLNSKLTGVPQLMEIVTQTSRNFISRDALFSQVDSPFNFTYAEDRTDFNNEIAHFKPDYNKINPIALTSMVWAGMVLEKVWGSDIQIEFVINREGTNIVQVRDLPRGETDLTQEIVFPDEPSIHQDAAIGVGNMILPLLDPDGKNREKVGAVVIRSNRQFSVQLSFGEYDDALPKQGAVIIENSLGDNGHIQTLCAERGLVCIYPDPNQGIVRHHLSLPSTIRVVSNGLEGRIYEVPPTED